MQLPKKFQELHNTIFGSKMPEKILLEILNLVQNSWKLGDKYTTDHYIWCYKKILIKYGLLQENKDNTFTIISKRMKFFYYKTFCYIIKFTKLFYV